MLPLVRLLATAQGTVSWFETICGCLQEQTSELVHTVRDLMDRYGSIEFASEFAEGILLVAEEYFDQAFADAQPGPHLDFLLALVPYVWARWR